LDLTNRDLESPSSFFESWNMKSLGNRSPFLFTA
jgi:hypothetical protein